MGQPPNQGSVLEEPQEEVQVLGESREAFLGPVRIGLALLNHSFVSRDKVEKRETQSSGSVWPMEARRRQSPFRFS